MYKSFAVFFLFFFVLRYFSCSLRSCDCFGPSPGPLLRRTPISLRRTAHDNPRTPNVHISGSRRFIKHHQNSTRRPQRERKRMKMEAGEGKKKREFWGLPPFGPPPLGPPPFRPHFLWVRGPALQASNKILFFELIQKTGPKSAGAQVGRASSFPTQVQQKNERHVHISQSVNRSKLVSSVNRFLSNQSSASTRSTAFRSNHPECRSDHFPVCEHSQVL